MSEVNESEERKGEAALDTDQSDERELRDRIEAIVNKSPYKSGGIKQMKLNTKMRLDNISAMSSRPVATYVLIGRRQTQN